MATRCHLKLCPGCNRHVEPDEGICPFCDERFDCGDCHPQTKISWARLGTALTSFAGMTAIVACGIGAPQPVYGAPVDDYPDADAVSTDASDNTDDAADDSSDAKNDDADEGASDTK